jgi:hypothetical protein
MNNFSDNQMYVLWIIKRIVVLLGLLSKTERHILPSRLLWSRR